MQKVKAYNLTEKKVTAMKKAEYISDEIVVFASSEDDEPSHIVRYSLMWDCECLKM